MRVERDIAGIALFFTAGTASGAIAGHCGLYSQDSGYTVASAAITILAFLIAYCMSPDTSHAAYRKAAILLMFFSAGLLCHMGSSLHGEAPLSSTSAGYGYIMTAISRQADAFKGFIDTLPYPDKEGPAMIKALITGDKSDITKEVNDAFRDSGASHILALSGMHLGVIYAIMLKAFAIFGNSVRARKARSASIMLISTYYTLLTGAAASLVRALFFILLNEGAKMAGRQTRPMEVFFIALTLQLAIAPENIGSAGFQMSYLAMAGIYLLYPEMKRWFPGKDTDTGQDMTDMRSKGRRAPGNPMKRLWDAAALTISCQLFTAPAAWMHFGTFPEYFIITNLLCVPLSTFVMLTAAAVILLSYAGLCPDILIEANAASIKLMTDILTTISSLS